MQRWGKVSWAFPTAQHTIMKWGMFLYAKPPQSDKQDLTKPFLPSFFTPLCVYDIICTSHFVVAGWMVAEKDSGIACLLGVKRYCMYPGIHYSNIVYAN